MKVVKVLLQTMADGPGLRDSVYFAGCPHHCKGCHNPETWDFHGGYEIDVYSLADQLCENKHTDISLSGGDPLAQPDIIQLCRRIKEISNKSIWLWTGYTISDILRNPALRDITRWVDVIVDGPFMEDLPAAKWRGSNNQRLIRCRGSQWIELLDGASEEDIEYLVRVIEAKLKSDVA